MPDDDDTQKDQAEQDVATDDGPDVSELESDPAYNPQEEHLKDLKGG